MAKTRDDASRSSSRARWKPILRGLLAIALGIFVLVRPHGTVRIVALVIAIWVLCSGIVAIVHAFDLRRFARHWWLVLTSGIIGVVFGLVAISRYPELSIAFIVLWVSLWLLASGVVELATAVQHRRVGWAWRSHLLVGMASITAGTFALVARPGTLIALTMWIGISAIAIGVFLLMETAGSRDFHQTDTPLGGSSEPRQAA